MARRTSTKTAPVSVEPATPAEARAWLLNHQDDPDFPDGVTISLKGRLSAPASAFFTSKTGQSIASNGNGKAA